MQVYWVPATAVGEDISEEQFFNVYGELVRQQDQAAPVGHAQYIYMYIFVCMYVYIYTYIFMYR